MNERGNKRLSGADANKLTKECLQTALLYLMSEKPFEKISIIEIVKKSGVSRSSFYRNYGTKEDLLVDMSKNITTAISEAIIEDKYRLDTYIWYEDLFKFMKENEATIQLLYKANLKQKNSYRFIPALHEIFHATGTEEHYQLMAYESGLNAIFVEWFSRGMQEDISYMANLCNSFYGNLHHQLLGQGDRSFVPK